MLSEPEVFFSYYHRHTAACVKWQRHLESSKRLWSWLCWEYWARWPAYRMWLKLSIAICVAQPCISLSQSIFIGCRLSRVRVRYELYSGICCCSRVSTKTGGSAVIKFNFTVICRCYLCPRKLLIKRRWLHEQFRSNRSSQHLYLIHEWTLAKTPGKTSAWQ